MRSQHIPNKDSGCHDKENGADSQFRETNPVVAAIGTAGYAQLKV